MTKKLFFMLITLGFLLSSCSERHEFIKNKTEVLSEKEMRGMGKYTALDVMTNEVYHQSDDADEDITNKCEFDFYRPEELKGKVLPLVIFLHEGAFVTGNKNGFVPKKISKDLARMGYAVANMNYRLINNPRALMSKEATHRYLMQSVAQVRLGIQELKKMATKDLLIDTSKIYVMGWSAGGIIANSLLFTDREEALNYVSSGHRNNFIHNEAFDIPLNLAGVISIGGALMANDVDDQELKKSRCLMFHGTNDDMIPIGNERPLKRYTKGPTIDLSVIKPKIETNDGKKISFGFDFHIPDLVPQIAVRLLTSEVYGSEAILDMSGSKNIQLIEIKDGSHAFFLSENHFNENYKQMMKRIKDFIK
jgi:acetyl esterase/lipase